MSGNDLGKITTDIPARMDRRRTRPPLVGVETAQRSLEDMATPLTAEEAEDDSEDRPAGEGRSSDRSSREPVGSSAGSSRRHYH